MLGFRLMQPALELTSSGLHLNNLAVALLALSVAPATAFLHTFGRPFLVRALDYCVRQTCRACRFLASVQINVTTR